MCPPQAISLVCSLLCLFSGLLSAAATPTTYNTARKINPTRCCDRGTLLEGRPSWTRSTNCPYQISLSLSLSLKKFEERAGAAT